VQKRLFDWMIAFVSLVICVVVWVYLRELTWLWILTACVSIVFFIMGLRDKNGQLVMSSAQVEHGNINRARQLVLLNQDNRELSSWDLFGRTALVIGRDEGENEVDINLADITYAGFVDIEHAVLNFCGDYWYIEDLSSENGVRIQKKGDEKQYKLAADKPCRLDLGDIIHIAQIRLQVR